MKKIFLFLVILFGALLTAISQDTVILRPDPFEGKDAVLWSVHPESSYGLSQKFTAMGWTFYGVPGAKRSIIEFDLSQLPHCSEVSEAMLSLYFFSDEPTWVTHSGNNQSCLKLVTEEWNEEAVTWNTMPSTTDEDQVIVPQTTDSIQDYLIDVTVLINKMLQNPGYFHGLMLQLMNEEPYRSLMFASSDNEDSTLWPKLTIIYHFEPSGYLNYTVNNLVVSFFDNTPGAFSWHWEFGDGTTSDLQNPVHEYSGYGNYNAYKTVTTAEGISTTCETIYLQQTGFEDPGKLAARIYPNPCRDLVTIEISGRGTVQYSLFNTYGVMVKSGEIETKGAAYTLETSDLPTGMYFLIFRGSQVNSTLKMIVVH